MITRSRIFITAALLCHLLLADSIVTSQTLPPSDEKARQSTSLPVVANGQSEEPVTIRGIHQEKDGSIFHLKGEGEIDYRNYVLHGDEITYNSDTGDSQLEGHVILDGGPYDEHVTASHGTYNIRTQIGTFYNAIGTVGFKMHYSRYVLTTTNPFAFTGNIVEKHGPDHYVVHDGTVTTCELPRPKWQFDARHITVDVEGNAKIYNGNFQLLGFPIFYFPFVMHPVQKEQRQSGFLIPSFGNSSSKGFILGDSFFWVIDRSMDAMIGTEYFSRRGFLNRGDFRSRPSETAYAFFSYVGIKDRGIGYPPEKEGGEDVHFLGEHPIGDFRGVANIDYLSSFVFRIAFSDVYTQAIDSEVRSQVFLTNAQNGFHFDALAERYQDFEVCNPSTELNAPCATLSQTELVRILHTPSFLFSGEERELGQSPLYWSFDSAAEALQRQEVGFRTGPLVGRLDFAPSLAMPLEWHGWTFRPELTLRDTFYTEQYSPALAVATYPGRAENLEIDRKSVEASVDFSPPAVSKIFEHSWLKRRWKHVVEPRLRYNYVQGVDNYDRILRFDARDILTDTNELEYGVVNRIYAKRTDLNTKDCAPQGMSTLTIGGVPQVGAVPWELPPIGNQVCSTGPREILSWEIAQKYYFDPTFGNALLGGERNVFAATADLTGIAFLNEPRHLSPLISRLRVETNPRVNTEWDLDYDFRTGRINASTALVNYHYGPFTIGGGDAFLRVIDTPVGAPSTTPNTFNQFRLLFGYGELNKHGLSAATSIGFDANLNSLQYASVQTTYNWDCCGLSLEYRRFALGSVRDENEYRFSFTLANVGAFGNLRRQERLY
jgi:LPS-assembly protein